MICDALTKMPWLTPADALSASLQKARSRLPVGDRVVSDNGTYGTLVEITSDGYLPIATVVTDDGETVITAAGHWNRSVL